jgi:hypothetical protein
MEVPLTPELEAKLNEAVKETGRRAEDLVHGYLQELIHVRSTLDQRYDDIKSGKAVSIDGEEVFARLRRKSEERRSAPS